MGKDSHDGKEPRLPGGVVVEQQRSLDRLPCESMSVGYKSSETGSLKKPKDPGGGVELMNSTFGRPARLFCCVHF